MFILPDNDGVSFVLCVMIISVSNIQSIYHVSTLTYSGKVDYVYDGMFLLYGDCGCLWICLLELVFVGRVCLECGWEYLHTYCPLLYIPVTCYMYNSWDEELENK